MRKDKERIKELDIIRALAISIIVIGHLHEFLDLGFLNSFLEFNSTYIAQIGLSLFFFISGFSLYYNNNSIGTFKDLINFYRKRLIRIYPLYWLAIIVTLICYSYFNGFLSVEVGTGVSLQTLSLSLFGLQGFLSIDNQNILFWFIGVILLFYLIFPLIIRSKNIINMFTISTIIFVAFTLIRLELNVVHINYYYYYWSFVTGIAICLLTYNYRPSFKLNKLNYNYKIKKLIIEIICLISVMLLLIFINPEKFISSLYYIYVFVFISSCLIIYFVAKKSKDLFHGMTFSLISKIAFCSYAIYLFHITILFTLLVIFKKMALTGTILNLCEIVIGISMVFILGYYIQKLEFKLRSKLRKNI